MQRIFLPVYRFLKAHRALMWVLLCASAVLFAVEGAQLRFEEDILKLLPQTQKASDSGIAFGQLAVKDKIILQFISAADSTASREELAQCCDDFVSSLLQADSASHLVNNVLYRFQSEWAMNGLDWALTAFPAYLAEEHYSDFDSLLTRPAIFQTMARNAEQMAEDFDGNLTTVICYDPAGLRQSVTKQMAGLGNARMKFKDSHIFTADESTVLAFISPAATSFDSRVSARVDVLLEKVASAFRAEHPGVDVVYHGATERSASNSRQIKKDLVLTLSLALLLIVLLLLVVFKDFRTMAMMLLPILYGTFFAMACMYWIKGSMSLMALGIGAIVLGIGVSYVLHVLLHFKFTGDAEAVLQDQSTPVCMSCLTTIGAFAGLLFTQSDLLKDFGIFACFMLIGSTFAALVFLPQFFDKNHNKRNDKAFRVMGRINSYPLDKKYLLAALLVAVIAVSAFFSGKVGFDSNLQNINYSAPVIQKSEDLYSRNMNLGLSSVYYAARGGSLDEALDNNIALAFTLDSLRLAGVLDSYSAPGSFLLTQARQQENIDRWKNYWTEERIRRTRRDISDAARANGLEPDIFDMFFTLVEADYQPSDILESGAVPEEISCNFVEKVGDEYLVFSSALMEPEMKRTAGDAVSANPHSLVVDPFYYAADLVEIVHDDYSKVLYISSLFVLLVLLVTFCDLLVALMAFMPMFLSWFVVEGLMAIFGLEFNLLNIVISSFVFGVGVDYSIFIMDGLLRRARGGGERLLVYHKTAILLSAVILIVVVALLLLAKSPAISSVGVITLIGMASTILIAYCLMPLCFRVCLRVAPFKRRVENRKR